MLVSARTAFALRCPKCGTLEMTSISRFSFSGATSVRVGCSCGSHMLTVTAKGRQLALQIPCYLCDGVHFFYHDSKSFWAVELKQISCAETDLQVGVFGGETAVSATVKPDGNEMERLLQDEAFDDYFEDRTVMYRLLNRLNQLTDEGKLTCSCGNHAIAVDVYPDQVELSCSECDHVESVPASTIEDVTALERLTYVEIGQGHPVRKLWPRPKRSDS